MTTTSAALETAHSRPAGASRADGQSRAESLGRIGGQSRIAVVCATKGRAAVLRACLPTWQRQTHPPSGIVIACTGPADVEGLDVSGDVAVVESAAGLTRQRNAGLDRLPDDTDVVVFFDDDFVPDARWLEVVAGVFQARPDIVCVTGNVVRDGIHGPGLSLDEAEGALAAARTGPHAWMIDGFSPYGCNMAFRRRAIEGLRFDERLVLYGWQEDRDFGGMLARRGGRLVKVGAALGVHLGTKRGRAPGRMLGYSQVANPLYLARKGTMRPATAANHILCNMGANALGALSPEPFIDRRGRLVGNFVALRDLVRGVLAPERAAASATTAAGAIEPSSANRAPSARQ